MSLAQGPFTDLQLAGLQVSGSFAGNIAIGITKDKTGTQLADNSYVVIDPVNRVCNIYLKIAMSDSQLSGSEGDIIVDYTTAVNPINGEIPVINTEAPNSALNPIVFRGNYSSSENQFNTADFGLIGEGDSNQIILLENLSPASGSYVLSGTVSYPY